MVPLLSSLALPLSSLYLSSPSLTPLCVSMLYQLSGLPPMNMISYCITIALTTLTLPFVPPKQIFPCVTHHS